MANVPVVIFQYAMSPYDEWHALAWAGAFVLTVFVLRAQPARPRMLRAGKGNDDERSTPSAIMRRSRRHAPAPLRRRKIAARGLDFYYGKPPRAEERQPRRRRRSA